MMLARERRLEIFQQNPGDGASVASYGIGARYATKNFEQSLEILRVSLVTI